MTNQEAIEMMKAKLECMTREVSGVDLNCNAKKCDECDLCYAQGNMGEQKDWLRMGIEALEKQKPIIEELEKIKAEINNGYPTSVEDILWIIDNKMSEMKGENKLTCDRNICLKNEYSNIGCEDCVVTKGEQK